MRNPVACIACRAAKRQCHYNHTPPCKRCRDRGEACLFPAAGTSYIHRQRKNRTLLKPRQSDSATKPAGHQISNEVSELLGSEQESSDVNLALQDPFELFGDEVKTSFLRCSYKWSFYHTPTLLRSLRNKTIDLAVLWAILALAIRFSKDAPLTYKTPLQASNAFAGHAKSIVLPSIEEPSLNKIQALLMITGHSWGAGEGHRAWMYLGMAVRMAQLLELFDEALIGISLDRDDPSAMQDAFIAAEERRRTAWTCFLMDSLLSGGKRRRRLLSADDMRIQLPCDTNMFHFAEPVRCESLDGTFTDVKALTPIGGLDIVAYSMRIADIWGEVAKWACSPAVHTVIPWEERSEFQHLMHNLNRWRASLPHRLQFSIKSLHAHSAASQGQAYCYMHSIYFMSIMFLHRSYLSRLEIQNQHNTSSRVDCRWRTWQTQSRKELLRVSDQVCGMYEEMREFGLGFLCGLVPWIGFTIYTAVGIMLYYHHFPEDSDDLAIMSQSKDMVVNGCEFLRDMRGSWPMADCWRETIKRMQIFYTNIKTKGEQSVSQTERSAMRDAIVDYGALQNNKMIDVPVQSVITQAIQTSPAASSSSVVTPAEPVASPYAEGEVSVSSQDYLQDFTLNDVDVFDVQLSITDADVEGLLSTTTQDFWANFPGEVEMY